MFLRVLLNLVMHNYPPLVSGALQLLFRHFSQRQEVLQAFKQVGTHSLYLQSATRAVASIQTSRYSLNLLNWKVSF